MKEYESPRIEEIEIKVEDILYESFGDDGSIEWEIKKLGGNE